LIRHTRYTRDRVAQVAQRLQALIHADTRRPDRMQVAGPVGRIAPGDASLLSYREAALGDQFGPLWATFWLQVEATVPEAWAGERVDLLFVTHGESTLWIDGEARQGLSLPRTDAMLVDPAAGGERLRLALEIACNGPFGAAERPFASLEPIVLDRCEIARFDPWAFKLAHDIEVLRQLELEVAATDPAWAAELLEELNRFCNVWSEQDRGTWDLAESILGRLLSTQNAGRVHEMAAIGHGHLDTAWLWPLEETYRKAIRTFSSQLGLMERYPEHRFACSQAQHYEWIRTRYPGLYDRIRERVSAGQWIPVGGTWVEPDCNLPSGESLVRQFLYGQRFFEQEFGRRCGEFWNPDVFGYNGQLPQIMRGAGITRFLTQKLSWNRFNKPAHHTFTWQGIDGSEVLAHFPPADTYNSEADVRELRAAARDYLDHAASRTSLLVFGHGDGGGGPTATMLETLRRGRDLQGLPRTRIASSEEFFDALEAGGRELTTIVGELYFEYHRGTYTTQAAAKRANRACERMLHDVEFMAAMADRHALAAYPADLLSGLWRVVLLNQFHDIIPGSGITLVYEDAARDYASVLEGAGYLAAAAETALSQAGTPSVPLNTTGFARAEVVELPGGEQAFASAPAYGVGALADPPPPVTVTETRDVIVLANGRLRAEIGRDGTLRSLVELESGREALSGPGNVLQLYDDRPTHFDAWDVDPFHLQTVRDCPAAESVMVAAAGPLRAEVAIERPVSPTSRMQQVVRLDAGAGRLEFHCTADWQERHTMLKVLFRVAVHGPMASYQMQFGHADRPTHYSTTYDAARYEVPGHRFADLSEHGFGVALLTDCKYGYSTYGDEMRISLLRSPASPDPTADLGRHVFAFAVMPHRGGWREAGVVAEAAWFESPLRLGPFGPPRSFASVDDPNLVLDTIKRAEDSDAIVLRLYEAHGARGTARLRLGFPATAGARRCNLLEDPGEPLEMRDGIVEVPYRPYEIVSLLV
jgi:alpha-mannosidase